VVHRQGGGAARFYALSWQIVPTVLQKLIADADRQKAKRTMEAMLKMVKLDIAQLQRAHEGR
jgi:predicted 3-demethylubiquinone-9 3-methyltransferase (glyoxalase superfamily)